MRIKECLFPGDIIGQKDGMSAAIEHSGHWFEAFLAGSVPNLGFDDLVFQSYLEIPKFKPNGYLMLLFEVIFGEAIQEAGFAYCRITDNDHFQL